MNSIGDKNIGFEDDSGTEKAISNPRRPWRSANLRALQRTMRSTRKPILKAQMGLTSMNWTTPSESSREQMHLRRSLSLKEP